MNKKNNHMDGYSLTEKMRKARRRNRLTATEQALFYELVAVCNSEGWEDVFSCSNIELCFSLNIDEKTLIRARLLMRDCFIINQEKANGRSVHTLFPGNLKTSRLERVRLPEIFQ